MSFLFRNLGADSLSSSFRKHKPATIIRYGGGGLWVETQSTAFASKGRILEQTMLEQTILEQTIRITLRKGQMLDYSVTTRTEQKCSRSLHACALNIVNSKRSSQAYE